MQRVVSGSPVQSRPAFTYPAVSPNRVVEEYLSALKGMDFRRAYKHISLGYAGGVDPEGYEINMKKGLVENLHWSLNSYEVVGVKVLGDQAYVLTDLGVTYKLPDSPQAITKKVRVQYNLSAIDKKWVIVGDSCVEGCEKAPGIEFKEIKPIPERGAPPSEGVE
ncbi:MAG: hypothetical protein QXI19_01695 [Candidatus Caldarchaeum sp.]